MVEFRSLQFKDVFYVFERLLDLEPVLVDPSNLRSATCLVVGQNVPRFRMSPALWRTDDPQAQPEQLNDAILLSKLFELNALAIEFDVTAGFDTNVEDCSLGIQMSHYGLITKPSVKHQFRPIAQAVMKDRKSVV